MKNLFVTFNTNGKKKDEKKEIFKCCERKNEKIDINENLPSFNTQEIPLNNTFSSSASSTTNSSTESRKISYNNLFITEPQIFVNPNTNNNISNNSNLNQFLGKKTKIHFDIIKSEETKEINSNNLNILTSQIMDNLEVNKDIEKSDSLELSQEKTFSKDFNETNSSLKIKKKKNLEKVNFLNEGRWSYHEHIKFIEAIAKYGKNWKDVQKYVGSRSSAQARSHAQKFYLKLKTIKNPKLNFDFTSNDIKSISDIINIIKSRKQYFIEGESYIINTLISLSESINYDENMDSSRDSKISYKILNSNTNNLKNDEIITKDESSQNNDKQLRLDMYNIYNNNSKKECINSGKKDENINNKNIEIKGQYNNILNNIVEEDIFNDEFQKQKIESSDNKKNDIFYENKDYCFIDNIDKYIIDDGIMYLQEDSDIFNYNNISLKIKEYYYLQNFEMPNPLYNKYFFS